MMMTTNILQQFPNQGSYTEQQSSPSELEISEGKCITLLVRHLPEAIPHDMLSRLFSYYGASSFRACSGGSLRNCAFVDFKDEASASLAQSQLNRLKFHKKVLSVERTRNSVSENKNQQSHAYPSNESSARSTIQSEETSSRGNIKGSLSSPSFSEPIAPKIGVDYPFPSFLEYSYPPPDGNILTNIVNALIAVPRFYTQVLHLMNKMNIPAPFRMALPVPPLPPVPAPPPPPPPPAMEEPPMPDISSDESELESSEEDVTGVERRKRRRREAIIGPAIDKGVAHEDVGLKPTSLVPKEVPLIKKKNPIMQIKIASKASQTDYKGGDHIPTQVTETHKVNLETKSFAIPEELESGKLPLEEIISLPKFKAYATGKPNNVLYIKNLAKDLVVDDFYFIFGSLFGSSDAARSCLHVKLMQEGRMRDQAFITFPSVDLAQRALKLVNGYVFKGKPMVIQFGRKSDSKTS